MTVDRGGLQYKIEVIGDFTALTNFKRELRATRAQYLSLRRDINTLRSTRKQLSSDTKALARSQQEIARITAKAARDQAASTKRITKELAAQNRELALQRKQIQRVVAENRRLATSLRAATKAKDRAGRAAKRLNKELGTTESRANRIAFTFRRLFGILAAFALAREAIARFGQLIRSTLTFNAKIEEAQLGLAALFTAVGEVADAQGRAVEGAEALAAAQTLAADQTRKLRIEALATAATFDDLLDTFQVAIAPGLTAGLDLDEIRQFTVRISQAAAAIALPQNQLAEEIRSLLQGTIQLRTTRIAAALGITNEDIRRAKELGELAQFLQDRFEAFGFAGEAALGTFNVLLTNVRDGFLQLLEIAGTGFFEETRQLLEDLLNGFRSVSDLDVTINPRALAIISGITSGLQVAVGEIREIFNRDNFLAGLTLAQALGQSIAVSARIISGIIQGFLRALRVIRATLTPVVRLLQGIASTTIFNTETLEDAVALIVEFFVIYKTLGVTTSLIHGLWTGMVALSKSIGILWGIIRARAVGTAVAVGLMTGGLTLLLGIISALVVGIFEFTGFLNKSVDSLIEAETEAFQLEKNMEGVRESVTATSQALKDSVKTLEELRKEAEKAQDQLEVGLSGIGLSGPARQQILTLVGEEVRLRRETFDLQTAIRVEEAKRRRIAQELADIAEREGDETQRSAAAISVYNTLTQRSFRDDQRRLEVLQEQLATLQKQRRLIAFDKNDPEAQRLSSEIANVAAEIASIQTDAFRRTAEQAQIITNTLEDQLSLRNQSQESLNQEDLLRSQIAEVERRINATLSRRLQLQARQAAFDADREARLAAIEVQLQRANTLESLEVGSRGENALDIAEARQALEQARLDLARESAEAELAALRQVINEQINGLDITQQQIDQFGEKNAVLLAEAAIKTRIAELNDIIENTATDSGQIGEAQRKLQVAEAQLDQARSALALLQQESAQRQLNNAELAEQAILVTELEITTERLRAQLETPLQAGFLQGIRDFVRELPSAFEISLNTMKGLLDGFAQFGAAAFRSIFDPNSSFDPREAMAQLLADLATQIITWLIQIALAKTILAPFLGEPAATQTASAAVGPFQNKHDGGPLKPIGFDSGGAIPNRPAAVGSRPSGLHPADKVPFWGQAKEWVIRAKSAMMYGADVMSRINRGQIDPTLLRTIAGLSPGRRAATIARAGLGFVSGGELPSAPTTPVGQPTDAGGASGAGIAGFVPTKELLEALVMSDDGAFLREFISDTQGGRR